MAKLFASRKIDILPVTQEFRETIQNLGRFYAYDMSEYIGESIPGWSFPENGLYEGLDFRRYWQEPERYSFLIRVNGELAGFVLINKIGTTPDIDWEMAEFFVIRKFRHKGVGRYVATWCFSHFPGVWEITQIPTNKPAIQFWKKVIGDYTHGNLEESLKDIGVTPPHLRSIIKFRSN